MMDYNTRHCLYWHYINRSTITPCCVRFLSLFPQDKLAMPDFHSSGMRGLKSIAIRLLLDLNQQIPVYGVPLSRVTALKSPGLAENIPNE